MSAAVTWHACEDENVRELLLTHYGLRPGQVERLARESVNSLWRLRCPESTFVLKRLGRAADARWLAFQDAATARADAHGLPVQLPVPASDGSTTVTHGGGQWQLRRYVEGRLFTDGSAADVAQAARCLDILHAVPYDDLPSDAPSPTQDLEHWLATTDEARVADVWDVPGVDVPTRLRESAHSAYLAAYRRARTELDGPTYRSLPMALTHGEFMGSNLVHDAEDGTLRCVLDWDAVDVRPRVYDLARAALFLARKRRGGLAAHPRLATEVLLGATTRRPAGPQELAAVVPVLELYFVPTPRYVSQLADHSPDTLEWYLRWAAEGAATVRSTLGPAVAEAARRSV